MAIGARAGRGRVAEVKVRVDILHLLFDAHHEFCLVKPPAGEEEKRDWCLKIGLYIHFVDQLSH